MVVVVTLSVSVRKNYSLEHLSNSEWLLTYICLNLYIHLCYMFFIVVLVRYIPGQHDSSIYIQTVYSVSQDECARLREGVPYIKVYRYNPKHLCAKLNGYGDNDQRKVWSSGGSKHCTCQLTILSMPVLECGFILRQFSSCSQ